MQMTTLSPAHENLSVLQTTLELDSEELINWFCCISKIF